MFVQVIGWLCAAADFLNVHQFYVYDGIDADGCSWQ